MRPMELGPEHAQEIIDLQDAIVERFGAGRIWRHDVTGLERLFERGPDVLVLGVRSGPRLIAVSLSRLMDPFEVRPILPGLPWAGDPAHIGLNTLSLPGTAAGAQMLRLLHARRDRLRGRGVYHLFGGIAPDHPVPLGCAFRAGAIGVGHLEIDGEAELLLWRGPGAPATPSGQPLRVANRNLDLQADLMRTGYAATGLDPEDRTILLFSRLQAGPERPCSS